MKKAQKEDERPKGIGKRMAECIRELRPLACDADILSESGCPGCQECRATVELLEEAVRARLIDKTGALSLVEIDADPIDLEGGDDE